MQKTMCAAIGGANAKVRARLAKCGTKSKENRLWSRLGRLFELETETRTEIETVFAELDELRRRRQ